MKPLSILIIAFTAYLFSRSREYNPDTGWAEYADSTYTSGSPFSMTGGTEYTLPNNAQRIRDSQKPPDVDSFFNRTDTTITGRNGDGLNVFIYFKGRPSTATATYIDVSIDIGGGVGQLYQRTITFPKGNGVETGVSLSFAGFTLDTWESNGGKVKVTANANLDVYNIVYILTRTSKAR